MSAPKKLMFEELLNRVFDSIDAVAQNPVKPLLYYLIFAVLMFVGYLALLI